MPATFSRTLRSLETDSLRRRAMAMLVVLALLGAWVSWFLCGRVAVYEVSDSARLEVESAAHPVAARVAGQVVTTRLQLGAAVKKDEVLVELDSEAERLALKEARARLKNLRDRLDALREQIRVAREAAVAHDKAETVAVLEARARLRAAEANAELADAQAATQAALRRHGVASQEELREAQAKAKAKRADAQARELEANLLEESRAAKARDRGAKIAELKLERVKLEGQAAIEEESIRRLEREVRLRRIAAPVAGRVGQAAELRVGSVVQAAQELGAIVPSGKPRVVAFFPAAAVGRTRPGQPARVRLDGFPWTQFGMPLATVGDVGNEPLAGRVRVELTLDLSSAPAIPLEHGLTGTVEVEVERISPAEVVLRAAGRLLSGKAESSPGDGRSSRG